MTKTILVTLATCALVACGGGSASSPSGTRQGSHPDQGTAAPHIECGSGTGHHGGGCGDGSGGSTTTTAGSEAAPPATTTTAPK